MKTFALISSFFLIGIFASTKTNAQLYQNAIGIRLGPSTPAITNGISFKHFLNEKNALEGLLTFGDLTGIAGLYEIHQRLPVENLQWFIGGGGYVAFGAGTSYVGGTGIVGLDYKFATLPLNLSIDWKPELNIVPRVFFEGATVGFSARFTFGSFK